MVSETTLLLGAAFVGSEAAGLTNITNVGGESSESPPITVPAGPDLSGLEGRLAGLETAVASQAGGSSGGVSDGVMAALTSAQQSAPTVISVPTAGNDGSALLDAANERADYWRTKAQNAGEDAADTVTDTSDTVTDATNRGKSAWETAKEFANFDVGGDGPLDINPLGGNDGGGGSNRGNGPEDGRETGFNRTLDETGQLFSGFEDATRGTIDTGVTTGNTLAQSWKALKGDKYTTKGTFAQQSKDGETRRIYKGPLLGGNGNSGGSNRGNSAGSGGAGSTSDKTNKKDGVVNDAKKVATGATASGLSFQKRINDAFKGVL